MAYEGWISVSSIEEAEEKVQAYQTATASRFCSVYSCKNFGRTDPFAKPHRAHWDGRVGIPFSGVPFFILGEKLLECHHGKDRNIRAKRKYQEKSLNESIEHGCTRKKRKHVQTKKLDCPAQLLMKEVMFFPDYKISKNTEKRRTNCSTKLRTAIKEGGISSCERRIYIHFPDKGSHRNHIIGEGVEPNQPMVEDFIIRTVTAPLLSEVTTEALALPCDPVPMSLTSAQLIQYVVVRGDLIRMLSWPTGAVIAQACHASTAVLWMHRNDPNTIEYTRELDHMHKVVLEAPNQGELEKLSQDLSANQIDHKLWIEQPENFPTCLATKPYPKDQIQTFFRKLKLFK